MKINELRVGNWVYAFKTTWQVDNTCFSNIGLMETYKPIPLTEEWLIKFRFYKQINDYDVPYYFTRQPLNITKERFSGLYQNGNHFALLGHGLDVLYVHQLQNLYFALTRQELIYEA